MATCAMGLMLYPLSPDFPQYPISSSKSISCKKKKIRRLITSFPITFYISCEEMKKKWKSNACMLYSTKMIHE
uniref:Uncharacterized protein n=1 Tax=Solanum lycopersicum TaxID=4081 RepID=A0A3Q7HE11_SOLLC